MTPIKTKSNSTTSKAILVAIVFFLILLTLGLSKMKSHAPAANASSATMIFSFSSDKKQTFTGPVVDKMSVLEAMLASAQGGNIKISYFVDNKNNIQLSSINKTVTVAGHKWNFYLNNNLIKTEDINKIFVKTGDVIEARYL